MVDRNEYLQAYMEKKAGCCGCGGGGSAKNGNPVSKKQVKTASAMPNFTAFLQKTAGGMFSRPMLNLIRNSKQVKNLAQTNKQITDYRTLMNSDVISQRSKERIAQRLQGAKALAAEQRGALDNLLGGARPASSNNPFGGDHPGVFNGISNFIAKNPKKSVLGAATAAYMLSGNDNNDRYAQKYASEVKENVDVMNMYEYNLQKQASAEQMYNEAAYDMQAAEAMYVEALQKMASAQAMYKVALDKNKAIAAGAGVAGAGALAGAGYAAANGMLGQGAELAASHALNNVSEAADKVKQPLLAAYSAGSTAASQAYGSVSAAMGNMADAAKKSLVDGAEKVQGMASNVGTQVSGAMKTVQDNPRVALAPVAGTAVGAGLGATAGYYAGKHFNAPRTGAVAGGLVGGAAGLAGGLYANQAGLVPLQ